MSLDGVEGAGGQLSHSSVQGRGSLDVKGARKYGLKCHRADRIVGNATHRLGTPNMACNPNVVEARNSII